MRLSNDTFRKLADRIHEICGIVVPVEKEYLIQDRLTPLIYRLGLPGFDALAERLADGRDPTVRQLVIDAIATGETSFFRDPGIFTALASEILPPLLRVAVANQSTVRIWSAGTSTGQEAYSLAIVMEELQRRMFGAECPPSLYRIVGTDISRTAIAVAKCGVYQRRDLLRGLCLKRIEENFEQQGPSYQVCDRIRSHVTFQCVNLNDCLDGLGPFDLICCRNVLIYFDTQARQRFVEQSRRLLKPDGWLLLGSAENLYGITNNWESVPLGNHGLIYQMK